MFRKSIIFFFSYIIFFQLVTSYCKICRFWQCQSAICVEYLRKISFYCCKIRKFASLKIKFEILLIVSHNKNVAKFAYLLKNGNFSNLFTKGEKIFFKQSLVESLRYCSNFCFGSAIQSNVRRSAPHFQSLDGLIQHLIFPILLIFLLDD